MRPAFKKSRHQARTSFISWRCFFSMLRLAHRNCWPISQSDLHFSHSLSPRMQWIVFLSLVLIAHGFQSAQFTLSTLGIGFQSANTIEDLSTFFFVRSVTSCAALCLRDIRCRTFEFDVQSQSCRLFEGSVDTGSLLSAASTTLVGWINVDPSTFEWYNGSSDQCVDHRFLSSDNPSGLCRCFMNTFWDGSMCVNQKYSGDVCVDTHWCRSDLALGCNGFVCTSKFNC
jgi:hypothetical protein